MLESPATLTASGSPGPWNLITLQTTYSVNSAFKLCTQTQLELFIVVEDAAMLRMLDARRMKVSGMNQ